MQPNSLDPDIDCLENGGNYRIRKSSYVNDILLL